MGQSAGLETEVDDFNLNEDDDPVVPESYRNPIWVLHEWHDVHLRALGPYLHSYYYGDANVHHR
jgi:hypothetical protein